MTVLPARIVVAGTHSGVGKTTVATGLMAALSARGHRVGAGKVGPDFIDPGYHSLAIGRPSRNLDAWISGVDAIAPLAARASQGCDVLVVEGVMGLFDGAGDGNPSSTADVASIIEAPVLLVVDAAALSQSVAPIVHGFTTFDPRVRIAGVVLNRVGSASHVESLVEALRPLEVPVIGALPRDERLVWRDRHLGLVPVAEAASSVRTSLDRLAALISEHCDLALVHSIAASARSAAVDELPSPRLIGHARVAVAAGPAFSFSYQDNLDALAAAGAELVPFDPTVDVRLPDGIDALVAGGGFPEVYGEQLAINRPLLDDVAGRARTGLVIWAECGGMLWLARQLDGRRMAGLVPTDAAMTDRLTLGYREATIGVASPLGPAGTVVRGHEFHYSVCNPPGDAMALSGRHGPSDAGFASERSLASYLHVHLAARPELAESFVAAAAAPNGSARTSRWPLSQGLPPLL